MASATETFKSWAWKRTKKSILSVFAITISTTSVAALEVTISKTTSATPAQAWQEIGDFCGIAAWHPAVEKCDLSEVMGAKLRKITLKTGGTIREQLVEQNEAGMFQRSLFLDGPLPVANYQATLKVVATAGGATYNWSGTFLPNSVPDNEAVKSVTAFYSAGIDALVAKSGK